VRLIESLFVLTKYPDPPIVDASYSALGAKGEKGCIFGTLLGVIVCADVLLSLNLLLQQVKSLVFVIAVNGEVGVVYDPV